MRILIAEDETIVRLDLRGVLEARRPRSAAKPATAARLSCSPASGAPTSRFST